MSVIETPRARIESLDQFRGYTVAGMLLVNFLGSFVAVPAILKHHNTYCSYADTIMPQFFFAVGIAYRLTFLRRWHRDGAWPAINHVIQRCAGLILLGFVVYHLDGSVRSWADWQRLGAWGFLTTAFQRSLFQTLVHIALASLWVLPVIGGGALARVVFLVASAALHVWVSSQFYYDWVMHRPGIDGGPLGFLTWSIPLLVGSLTYDAMVSLGERRAIRWMVLWGLVLMVSGYFLSCLNALSAGSVEVSERGLALWVAPPPFVPPLKGGEFWSMSQRAGSVSYLTFSSGFSLAVYALFVWLCDLRYWKVGLFRTFGQNALAAYVIHDLVIGAVKPFVPKDAPGWFVASGFLVYFGITYVFVRYLEKQRIFLRL